MTNAESGIDAQTIKRHLARAVMRARSQARVGTYKQHKASRKRNNHQIATQRAKRRAGSQKWTRKRFALKDLDATTLHCPNCSTAFEQSTWRPYDGFDEPGSPSWEYACPTNTCNTLFVFERNYE